MTTEKYNYEYFPTSEQLSEDLIKCFGDHVGNEKEKDLYNETYIKKNFKKFVDTKTFNWFWEEENIWYDAWVIFNKKIKTKSK